MSKSKANATDAAEFRGFGAQALPFLMALKENNDRAWFAEHKATFLEECDGPLRELVRAVGDRLARSGSPLAPIARSPVYRIYRDVRFSKDKSPYKTNLGAALHREGDKKRPGMLYIHVEPGGSFVAAGFYQPEPPMLRLLREAIVDEPKEFAAIAARLDAAGLPFAEADVMTRMPKGFEDQIGFDGEPFLKFRSFLVARRLDDADLERRDLPETVVRFAGEAMPLLEFFWARIGDARTVPEPGGSSGR